MSAKRPPLALKAEAFATRAISHPDPVEVATAASSSLPGAPAASPTSATDEGTNETSPVGKAGQPSRAGKVQVVAWVREERRAELKIVAAKLRRTVDDLLTSMIDELVTRNLGN
jgi:hypothetical protein